jgi:hypothetical protein
MCNCGKRSTSIVIPNCSSTTAETLVLYLSGYQRVIDENLYNELTFSEDYVLQQMQLINTSIQAKQLDSSSCTNSQFFDNWAQDYADISLL